MKFKERSRQDKGQDGPTLYLRLKADEAVNIIPRGEIYEFYSVFGTRGEITSQTPGAKLKYKMNVIVNEGGTLKAKIYEYGSMVYDQLAEYSLVCDVTRTKFKLSRKGSGKNDTEYKVLPLMNEPISEKLLATIEAIPLHQLGPKSPQGEIQAPPSGFDDFGEPPPDTNDELPF